MRATKSASRAPATGGDALAPEALLARSSAWRRLAMTLLIVVVAAPTVPWPLIAGWLGLYACIALSELARLGLSAHQLRPIEAVGHIL